MPASAYPFLLRPCPSLVCVSSQTPTVAGTKVSHRHGRWLMVLFLKPLIGFTTSTSILTSLMVLFSYVG
jgi:hypothetical protein